MATFTKTYKVQPNDKQREAMGRAFKSLASYFLNQEGKSVEIVVEQFEGKKIEVSLLVNGSFFEGRIIGVRGGVTSY